MIDFVPSLRALRSDSTLLDLEVIRDGYCRVDRSFSPSAFGVADEFLVTDSVHLVLDVHKDGGSYRLTGRIRSVLKIPCCRCLEGYHQPVNIECDLLYVPFNQDSGTGESEVKAEDLLTSFYTDKVLDLSQLMEEQFHLSVPMKPLCGESCKGLCRKCGVNLNQRFCACDRTWQDPRWSALEGLLKKEGNDY